MTRPSWMTRTLVVVSLVSFMQDAASELVYPLLPLLLTGALAAPPVVVGFVEGAATGMAALVAYVSGRGSDRIGRKPLVFSGYSLAAVGKIVVAAAWIWPVVLVGRIVDRVGKGIRGAPRDALIADAVPCGLPGQGVRLPPGDGHRRCGDRAAHRPRGADPARRRPAPGAVARGDPGGAVGRARAAHPGAEAARWSPSRWLPPRPSTRWPEPAASDVDVVPVAPAVPLSRDVRRVIGLLAAFALVNFPDVLVLLRLSDIGWSTAEVVGGYALYNFAYSAVSYPAGSLSDRMPRAHVYALGLVFFAIGYLGLGLLDSGPLVLVVLVLYGGFNGCTDGVGKAWVSSLAPKAARGRAQGAFQGFNGGGILIAGHLGRPAVERRPGRRRAPPADQRHVALVFAVALWTYGRRLG